MKNVILVLLVLGTTQSFAGNSLIELDPSNLNPAEIKYFKCMQAVGTAAESASPAAIEKANHVQESDSSSCEEVYEKFDDVDEGNTAFSSCMLKFMAADLKNFAKALGMEKALKKGGVCDL